MPNLKINVDENGLGGRARGAYRGPQALRAML